VQITMTTEAAPGQVNEDYAICGPTWAAVFDGATPGPDVDSGCIHDVPWLVRQLSGNLAPALIQHPDIPLTDALANAIVATADAHAATCDLSNPDSPSSTVAIARCRGNSIDHLVLADSPIIFRHGPAYDEIELVADTRSENLPSYTPESIRKFRNTSSGFWVASTSPEAAVNAVTGSRPAASVGVLYLLTDGASRFVDLLGLGDWNDFVRTIDGHGVGATIDKIRAGERETLPQASRQANGRRLKRHDDATVVVVGIENQR
jgi:hypothetical protein